MEQCPRNRSASPLPSPGCMARGFPPWCCRERPTCSLASADADAGGEHPDLPVRLPAGGGARRILGEAPGLERLGSGVYRAALK